MFVLCYKNPIAIHEGKSGYVMTWREKQLAICEEKKPLQDIIDGYEKREQERLYIVPLADGMAYNGI